jgi:hypothetical protein
MMRSWLKTWLVHRLCDLHTRLSLWRFGIDDWLERLDPTFPIPEVPPLPQRCIVGKLFWYDGRQVREQVLMGTVKYPSTGAKT